MGVSGGEAARNTHKKSKPLTSGDRIGLGHEITLVFDDPAERVLATSKSEDFTELEIEGELCVT